ncbi:MAG: HAMP domain-containing protein [Actinomycetales bacterium]|nr:HAMP domain-containing protein [Actinomycetales bacterium]
MLGRMGGAGSAGAWSPAQWWRRRGIRARSTIAAVAVVAAALVAGSVGLVIVLNAALTNSISQAVSQRAQDIAAQIASNDVGAATATAGASPGDATIVQVVDASGTVIVSSPSIRGEKAILGPGAATAGPSTDRVPLPFVDNDPYLVAARQASLPDGPVTVLAAQSWVPVQRVLQTVTLALAIAAPLLLLAVGLITWVAVGRSLESVDRIRGRVEDITAADLSERVPVPEAKDEVERLAVTMNHMLDRLDRSMSQQRRFIADASHELKSPLASMRATLDVAAAADGAAAADATRVLSDEVDRMTLLVRDLLILARSDEGPTTLRGTDVDIDDLVLAEVARLRAQTALTVDIDVEAARVHGDPDGLARALRNLVDNAARFAAQTVRVSVHARGSGVEVTVEDDGPGIPPDQREQVFDRFVRLDDHRSRSDGGSGLGLAIVREITRAHGGSVEIGESDLGGAQVVLTLSVDGSPTASSR